MFSKKPSGSEPQTRQQDSKPVQSPLFDKPADRPTSSSTPAGLSPAINPVQAKIAAQAGAGTNAMPPRPAFVGPNPVGPNPVGSSSAGPNPVSSTITPPSPFEKETGMTQQPPKPQAAPSPPSFRTDFRPEGRNDAPREPTRRVDLSGVAAPRTAEADPVRKLIVGRDISLNGEINACDYLVVEGTVEARVREGKRIEITDTGLFRGTVEIEEADIGGKFEGDITVRGRLRVRSTGRIEGKVQYGELEVEAGGQLEGDVRGLGKSSAKAGEKITAERMQTPGQAAPVQTASRPDGPRR